MQEETQVCKNCLQPIPKQKIRLHQARCHKHISKCEKCGKPVDSTMKQQHDQQYHKLVKCQHCQYEAEKQHFKAHAENCKKRPIECQYCQTTVPFFKKFEHQTVCENKTRKCQICTNFIKNRDWAQHAAMTDCSFMKPVPKVHKTPQSIPAFNDQEFNDFNMNDPPRFPDHRMLNARSGVENAGRQQLHEQEKKRHAVKQNYSKYNPAHETKPKPVKQQKPASKRGDNIPNNYRKPYTYSSSAYNHDNDNQPAGVAQPPPSKPVTRSSVKNQTNQQSSRIPPSFLQSNGSNIIKNQKPTKQRNPPPHKEITPSVFKPFNDNSSSTNKYNLRPSSNSIKGSSSNNNQNRNGQPKKVPFPPRNQPFPQKNNNDSGLQIDARKKQSEQDQQIAHQMFYQQASRQSNYQLPHHVQSVRNGQIRGSGGQSDRFGSHWPTKAAARAQAEKAGFDVPDQFQDQVFAIPQKQYDNQPDARQFNEFTPNLGPGSEGSGINSFPTNSFMNAVRGAQRNQPSFQNEPAINNPPPYSNDFGAFDSSLGFSGYNNRMYDLDRQDPLLQQALIDSMEENNRGMNDTLADPGYLEAIERSKKYKWEGEQDEQDDLIKNLN